MAVIDSFANMECIINGHRFVGWAAEDPPFEFDYEDAVDTEFGPDGALYAMGMPSLGGTWTFKMFPTSPTSQWAMQTRTEAQGQRTWRAMQFRVL